MKAFDKKSDTNLAMRTADAGVTTAAAGLDAAAGGIPVFSATWAFCKAIMGNAMNMRQQRVLEWLEMVQQHPELFRKELLESDEFQDAFVVALEDYMKIRTTLKRGIAQKIFLDYTATQDKTRFELERHNMTLRQISVDSLQFLGYLEDRVKPQQLLRMQQTLNSLDFDSSPLPQEQIVDALAKQNALSAVYHELHPGDGDQVNVPNKQNPENPSVHTAVGFVIKNVERQTHDRCLDELVSLGIISRDRYSTTAQRNGRKPMNVYHDDWNYTQYGKDFTEFLKTTQSS